MSLLGMENRVTNCLPGCGGRLSVVQLTPDDRDLLRLVFHREFLAICDKCGRLTDTEGQRYMVVQRQVTELVTYPE